MDTPRQSALPTSLSRWPTGEPFSRSYANELGVRDRELRRACANGELRRLVRGVYVGADVPETLELRARALRLIVPDDCFVADRTAAWLHGANVLAPNEHLDVPRVSLFRLPGCGRLRNGLSDSGERDVRRQDLMVHHGLAVTTPRRTALDLGRLQRRDLALAGMDAMVRLGDVTVDELLSEVERFKKMRGVVQLRHLTPLVDGGAASAGESALRLRWLDAGLPRPTLQVPVLRPDGRYFYLDMGLPDHRFGAEYDGCEWHGSPSQQQYDCRRRAWLREAERWELLICTREHVYGQQDAVPLLAAAWREHRSRRRRLLA